MGQEQNNEAIQPTPIKTTTTTTKNCGKRLVFTYGTLKKGFSNHRLMEELINSGDASYVGSYQTVEKYPLVCGPYRVPFLLNMPGLGDRVWGEVYSVSDPTGMARLDELEGTTQGHYQRLPIEISELEDKFINGNYNDNGNGDGDSNDSCVRGVQVEAYYAHPSYAKEMWEKNGEMGFVCYTHKEAKGYVRRQDRPQNLTFLDHIANFLDSSSNDHHCC